MPDKIVIREVPIEEVVKIHANIPEFAETPLEEKFEEKCKGKEALIIAAYLSNKPAGYLIGYDRFDDGSLYCWMVGAVPQFRRKGVLKALMNYEEKWAKNKGYNKIRIKTRNSRREMLAYLVKYGFFLTEVIKYPNIQDDRVLLEKEI